MNKVVGYCGAIWGRNVGDSAIYAANVKEFQNLSLVPGRHAQESEVTFLGGGTILPRALKPEWIYYDAQKRKYNYCFGVGVRDPDFYNRKRAKFDLRYYGAQGGINVQKLVRVNKGVKYIMRSLSQSAGGDVILDQEYIFPSDFELIKQYEFDRLTVRGPISKSILSENGISSEIVGDPALLLEPPEYIDGKQNKITVCLQGKQWAKKTGNNDYIAEVIGFCNTLPKEFDVEFIAFDYPDIPTNINAASQVSGSEFYSALHLQLYEILEKLSSSDIVIGERLHASVLAASCYTPFISLEYRTKNEDFSRSISMSQYNIELREVTSNKLNNLFEDLMSSREDTMDHLKSEVNERRGQLRKVAKEIEDEIV